MDKAEKLDRWMKQLSVNKKYMNGILDDIVVCRDKLVNLYGGISVVNGSIFYNIKSIYQFMDECRISLYPKNTMFNPTQIYVTDKFLKLLNDIEYECG